MEQETELVELLEQYNDNEQMKKGIHILLGDYNMEKRLLNRMPEAMQIEFCEFPIFTLMK